MFQVSIQLSAGHFGKLSTPFQCKPAESSFPPHLVLPKGAGVGEQYAQGAAVDISIDQGDTCRDAAS